MSASGSIRPDEGAPPSVPPPSVRPSLPPPPSEPTFWEFHRDRTLRFAGHLGEIAELSSRAVRSLLKRPLGVEYIPRVIILSFCRELAPTLTAVIVGGRIGSGMAAEVGAMNVTEQVDAIRALGADPAKKLVLPRVLAAVIVMPLLSVYALALGTLGAILVCWGQYDITPRLFITSSLEVVKLGDFFAGLAKTPFFGFLIAIIGCHFGLRTQGGTEGVGLSTTRTVVAVSIAILIADFILTKLLMVLQGG